MSKFKKLTFLKVLATVAWADGKVTNSELNVLKSFYRKFNLEEEEIQELNRYVQSPLSSSEQENLFKELILELNSPQEKKEIMWTLKEMAEADNKIDSEERDLLDQFENLLGSTNFTKRSFGKLRNLLSRAIFKPAQEINTSLEFRFRSIVQKKFDLKKKKGGYEIQWLGDRSYLACLFGTLMSSLGHVDGNFSQEENTVLQKTMKAQFDFGVQEIVLLSEIANEYSMEFDFYEVTKEINRLVSRDQRLKFMESLFELVVADGSMDYAEVEELRRITKALQISHKEFIDCKIRYRGQEG